MLTSKGGICPWCGKEYVGLLAYHICPDGSTFNDRSNKTSKDWFERNDPKPGPQPPKPEDKAIVHVPNKYDKLLLTKKDIEFLKSQKIKIDSDCIEVRPGIIND